MGPAGHVCAGCGREDKLYERGYCPRCSLRRRADALLTGPDGTIPAPLTGVRDAIAAAGSARGALNWLRRGAGAPVLAAIARGELGLSHQGLDSWPARPPADYVRALLVAHGALPGRDEALARLERDTAGLLASVTDAEDRRTLTAYATWRVLHRARWNASHRPAPRTATPPTDRTATPAGRRRPAAVAERPRHPAVRHRPGRPGLLADGRAAAPPRGGR